LTQPGPEELTIQRRKRRAAASCDGGVGCVVQRQVVCGRQRASFPHLAREHGVIRDPRALDNDRGLEVLT
jgi:hypothetical protein